jgi:hypothetical protein
VVALRMYETHHRPANAQAETILDD